MDAQLSAQLGDIRQCLGRIEGSQKAFADADVVHTTRLNQHTGRITKLERLRWYAGGGLAVLLGLGALALRLL